MMKISCIVWIFALLVLKVYGEVDEETASQEKADKYLEDFGYVEPSKTRTANPAQRKLLRTNAIKDFQRFAHLPQTGELDEATKKTMEAPRCGMSDKVKVTRSGRGPMWDQDIVTWAFKKPTAQLDPGAARRDISEAFAIWSKHIPVNFTEVNPQEKADLVFEFGAGNHGNCKPFDGRSGVLAHAAYPPGGYLHFDDDEQWSQDDGENIRTYVKTHFLSVAVHEIGHAIGLPHTDEPGAIMNPIYRAPEVENGQIKPFVLSHYDVKNIQNVYGPREGATPRPTTPPPTPSTPEPTPPGGPTGAACPRFQAAVTGVDGATYFFDANSNVGWRKQNVATAPPNAVTKFYSDKRFPGSPSKITVAFTDTRTKATVLLDGRKVYGYWWNETSERYRLDKEFPKDLKADITFTPEGAFEMDPGAVIIYGGGKFASYSVDSNNAVTHPDYILKNYYGEVPVGKPSFAVGSNVYFFDETNYYVYDVKSNSLGGPKPLNSLISC